METAIKKAIEGGWAVIVTFQKGVKKEILVDKTDLLKLLLHKWHLTSNGYAVSWIDKKRIRMHHFLMGKPPKGKEVDHINRNRLDNRRDNLRFVSSLENGQNSTAVGVRKRGNSWEANLCFNYRKLFKGGFKSKKEALEWRNYKKKELTKAIWI